VPDDCRKDIEALLVFSKGSGLKVIGDNTQYMIMSRDHNAGSSHNIKIDNCSFEKLEVFKYLGANHKVCLPRCVNNELVWSVSILPDTTVRW